jgi:glycosyltransferase involved in cell wall biosynthesis
LLVECLDSIKYLELNVPFDVVLCSDAGSDSTLQVAERELKSSSLSYKIIRRHRNGGVGASRNTILRESRGKFALMLDGDNSLFPKGPHHLLTAIEASVGATFAYGLLSVKQGSSYVDVMNYLPWDKTLFSEVGNYIDALTIVDREKVLNIGGYSESLSLYGWEDFDLWTRIAHFGGFGVQIKNFVATYLRRGNSMITTTNVDVRSALAEIRERSISIG